MKILEKLSSRRITQIIILGVVFYLAFAHQKYGIEKAAPIDAYCPFGAVESFLTFIKTGEFIKRIYWSSAILLFIFVFTNIFFGRIFCSHLCPLGTLQEFLRKFGKLIGFKKDFELPQKYDSFLRYLKYIVLLLAVISSFYVEDLIMRNYGPFSALMHFGEEFDEKIIGYFVLILLLIFALFAKSFWCRYLCPLGAFLAIINKINFFQIKRNQKNCNQCGICNTVCLSNLKIKEKKYIKENDCLSCGECLKNCPQKSLDFQIFKKIIPRKKLNILIFLLVFLPLLLIPFTSFWQTSRPSNIISKQGFVDVENIRGSNTLGYLIKTTGIPFEFFQEELGLPNNTNQELKLKLIGEKYNIKNKDGEILETKDFREVVSNFLKKEKNLEKPDCPFDEVDCKFPGKCGNYIDRDKNQICDHSQ